MVRISVPILETRLKGKPKHEQKSLLGHEPAEEKERKKDKGKALLQSYLPLTRKILAFLGL